MSHSNTYKDSIGEEFPISKEVFEFLTLKYGESKGYNPIEKPTVLAEKNYKVIVYTLDLQQRFEFVGYFSSGLSNRIFELKWI